MADIKTLGGKPVATKQTFTGLPSFTAHFAARCFEGKSPEEQARLMAILQGEKPEEDRTEVLLEAGITRFGLGPDGQPEVEYGGEKEVPESFDP